MFLTQHFVFGHVTFLEEHSTYKQILEHAERSWVNLSFHWKTNCLFRISKNICSDRARFNVQETNYILFDLTSVLDNKGVIEQFCFSEEQACSWPFQVELEIRDPYCFSLSFENFFWTSKELAICKFQWIFDKHEYFLHCCLSNILQIGKKDSLGIWKKGWKGVSPHFFFHCNITHGKI